MQELAAKHLQAMDGAGQECADDWLPGGSAVDCDEFIVLTEVEGRYANWPDRSSLLKELSDDELEAMLPRLQSGMVPKMEACLRAVRGGVPKATVIDGRVKHSLKPKATRLSTPILL